MPGFSGFAKIVHNETQRKLTDTRKEVVLARERADLSEAKNLSRLKDEFIAVLSHELKNPLNLIHMKAEMLARLPEARHIRRVQEVADAVHRSVVTQAQIIDDLLDFSRVRTGKLSLRLAPTDIAAIVRSVGQTMQADMERAGIELRLELPAEPVLIQGDAIRVEQIAWNLMTNALKFTPRAGTVVVQLGLDEGYVRLDVIDSGIGVAPDALTTIFDMFAQVPGASQRTRAGGLGIGLSLVRQLAQLHGGTAEAFSEGSGQGTRFTIRFPADASFVYREAGDTPADFSQFRNLRILVVEDSADSLVAMTDLFALYEAKVTPAANAEEALEAARGQEFDLVITDVNLPGMSGYELVSALRSLPAYGAVPVVAVTGRSVAQEEVIALEAGCDACLPKPFSLQAIADVIARLRAGGRH